MDDCRAAWDQAEGRDRVSVVRAWISKNWFVAGIAGVVLLAFLAPGPGAPGGWMHPSLTTKAGVALIFFFQGLSLNFSQLREVERQLRAGVASWRLHVFVEAFIFLAFPLLGLVAGATVLRFLPADVRTGFLFLCVLPTTISTAVVYTSLANGNTAGALFNASVSNIAGVVVTPLWVSAIMSMGGRSMELAPVIGNIASLVLVPIVVGQIVRPAIRATAAALAPAMRTASSLLILMMVYTAFAGSVAKGSWNGLGAAAILGALAGSCVILAITMALSWLGSRLAGFGREDRIAAFMCAPQKTLGAGVPMAQLIFAGNPALGLILLPVLIYHPLQLIVGAWFIPRLRAGGGGGAD